MAWTYILRCSDDTFYTGSTNGDIESRVWEHNNDDERAAKFTRRRRPVALAYAEHFDTVDAAFRREKQIQGWSRAKKRALIERRSRTAGPVEVEAGRFDRLSAPMTRQAQRSTGSATQ